MREELEKKTNLELMIMCDKRELSNVGGKLDLINRILRHDSKDSKSIQGQKVETASGIKGIFKRGKKK